MKISQLTVTNVTSYKEETTFHFDDTLNILIGPNGGGKSNIQKILAVVLSNYFIHQYDFKKNENESSIELIDIWNRPTIERNLSPFDGEEGDQIIEINLVPEKSDLKNIQLIFENLDKFNKERSFWETHAENYAPFEYISQINVPNGFTYRIVNLDFVEPEKDTPSWAFKEYLRTFFIYMRLSSRIPDIALTSPVFFFFSERIFNRNSSLQLSQTTDQNYFSGYRNAYQAAMGDNTDLFQLGLQHFLRIHRKAEIEASETRGVISQEIMEKDNDVKLLDKYLGKLGYNWGFGHDFDNVNYSFCLEKNGQIISTDKFSSGEKEIVHFLLAIFALNVKDGLIIIDEPELHLHPRWQRIILNLFMDLNFDRNNQFIVATHSPVFVSPDTINNISRVYRATNGSTNVALKDIKLPEKKDLVRMINSQNNESIFFADKVILVEGITDRLVFSSLIDSVAARILNYQAIEVVEVGGKHNLQKYRHLLDALKTPSFVVADLDYLMEVGSKESKELFIRNDAKSWKALNGKKSIDAASLLKALEHSIKNGEQKDLNEFWEYFEGRHKRLKDNLTKENIELMQHELKKLREGGIYVLQDGEVEAYLPDGITRLDDVVDMLENRNWILDIAIEQRQRELINIACDVLEANEEQKAKLLADMADKKSIFSPVQQA